MKYGKGYVILFLNNNIFEGEYLNGEKNGKGKEYDYNGQLIYEGEYLHGYKLNGKEYRKGIVVYEMKVIILMEINGMAKYII